MPELADELSYVPTRYPAATFEMGERLAAGASTMPTRWECFEWRRQLFSFHVRGNLERDERDTGTELEIAARLVNAALGGFTR